MTAHSVGLSGPVRDLLDRLDPDGVRLVEQLFSSATEDVVEVPPSAVDASVSPYSWLLRRIGAQGIVLTSAGYLPPTVVEQAMIELDLGREWIGKGNREYHTMPVLSLRESTQKLGLTRKHRGRLVLTTTGRALSEDPAALWRHLAAKTPTTRKDAERDAGHLLLLMVASGTPLTWTLMDDLLHRGMSSLGWAMADGRPLSHYQAFSAARDTYHLLTRLGALPDLPTSGTPHRPPSSGMAFARAAIRT